jgi:histidine decarboxylase
MTATATAHIAALTDPLARTFSRVESRMRAAHRNHLGYPYNLAGHSGVPAALGDYLINNLGDPYAGSHFASEVCDLEREAIRWLMELWHCGKPQDYWGSIGASGTEGNIWAMYLGREALPGAIMVHSREAHYSLPKAARILRIESVAVDCEPGGAIATDALFQTLEIYRDRPIILALTCGTTVKGAHDNIAAAIAACDAAGIERHQRFIHIDGALNAMVLPFVDAATFDIQPSFRHAIDSISTSGHKMIGTPMPCGALITRRCHADRVASGVAYLRSNDTTLMGSRNGHAVLAMWSRLIGHGAAGFRRDTAACLARTAKLVATLRREGVPAQCNDHALTVVFPQPNETIVNAYQLACNNGVAHAIVMPSATAALLDRFTADYLGWWHTANATSLHAAEYPPVKVKEIDHEGLHRTKRRLRPARL